MYARHHSPPYPSVVISERFVAVSEEEEEESEESEEEETEEEEGEEEDVSTKDADQNLAQNEPRIDQCMVKV